MDELKDVTIPVRIGGHWQAPSYRLDVKELLSNNKVLEEKSPQGGRARPQEIAGRQGRRRRGEGVADQLLCGACSNSPPPAVEISRAAPCGSLLWRQVIMGTRPGQATWEYYP